MLHSPRPRLAHVTTWDLSLRFLLFRQLLTFQEKGFEVYGVSAPGPWVRELEAAGIRHILIPHLRRDNNLHGDVLALRELYRAFRSQAFDIVHLHTPKAGILGKIAARLAGIPGIVNTIHGLYGVRTGPQGETVYSLANPWLLLEAASTKLSHFELSQNREDLDWLRQQGWLASSRSLYLGNGVDVEFFSPSRLTAGDRQVIRQKYAIPPESLVIGMVARLVWEKGYGEFLHAATSLKGTYPRLVFLSVGPYETGKRDAIPQATTDKYASAGIVRFLGMQQDMRELYASMDIFVLPSHREGFPRSAMEAASMGLPLVLSNIRGCRDVLTDGVNGVSVPPRDALALEKALASLVQQPALRHRMGHASRAKAVQEFDERLVMRKTLRVYETLMARAATGSPQERTRRRQPGLV